MRLQAEGWIATGIDMLDIGIRDLVVHENGTGMIVHAGTGSATGSGGGIATYRLSAQGITLLESDFHAESLNGALNARMVLSQAEGAEVLFVGADAGGLIGYVLEDAGSPGALMQMDWNAVETAALQGPDANGDLLAAWALHADIPPPMLADADQPLQVVALDSLSRGGQDFVLVACGAQQAVISYRFEADGQLAMAARMGAEQGLGIQAPTAMELVQAHGESWVILAAAGSSSISVMRLGPDGSLEPTDHVIDTASTHFRSAQALASVTIGDHVFVLAGGAGDGLTLMTLLPDGQLLWLDSLAGVPGQALHNITALAAAELEDGLQILAATEGGAGLARFSVPLAGLGTHHAGTPGQAGLVQGGAGADIVTAAADGDTLAGGAGDDILVAGPGETWMRGGAGADIFVMRAGSGPTHVLDFERGLDRLDLSDWSMLRHVDQLDITTTAAGARVEFRDHSLTLTAADGQPLGVGDLFPAGLLGPDSLVFFPHDEPVDEPDEDEEPEPAEPAPEPEPAEPEPEPAPEPEPEPAPEPEPDPERDQTIIGTPGDDTLTGGGGDDYISGWAGDDLIYGGTGNNTIWGGAGDDTIHAGNGNNMIGGGPGNDRIETGTGNDRIWGGPGDDYITTEGGSNVIWAGRGRDTIHGGSGDDRLGGGGGPDLIYGGGGNNQIWGGPGNDRIYAGTGNDTIQPGPGNDRIWGSQGADTFVFYRRDNDNRIQDFDPETGDTLRLFHRLWADRGELSAQEVVDRYAAQDAQGNVMLDFAGANTVIRLIGFDDLDAIADTIEIF